MARPVSSLESHPQRAKIIDALLAGQPYRHITAWTIPPVTPMALSRYKRSAVAVTKSALAAVKTAVANNDSGLTPDVTKAVTGAALTAACDPLLARIARHQATLDAEIGTAAGDARGVAALIGTDLRGIELHAKLTGRLDATPNQTNIMIVCPAGAQEPAVTLEPDAVTIDIGPRK